METSKPTPAATDAFTMPASAMYGIGDYQVSARHYFESRYGVTCHSISDQRAYNSGIHKYLRDNKATLVESREAIAEDAAGKDEDGPYPYWAMERGYQLYWYKGNLVSVSSTQEEDKFSIEVTHPIGVDGVLDEFKSFIVARKDAAVGVLLASQGGMKVKSVDFDAPVIDDLDLNYGTGFTTKAFDPIVAKLNANKAGLFLFHGLPGSGKSTFIKYLTSVVRREFIFIPVSMVDQLSSPSFLTLLMSHGDAVLVLEDAEQALQSREKDFYNSAVVSTLLNLSDGLLGNVLNISIVATYNADRQTIDTALLRKGRLLFDYNFDKLSTDDANRLAKHLGKRADLTEPTSLADVYNMEEDTNYVPPVQKSMGFGFVPPTTPSA